MLGPAPAAPEVEPPPGGWHATDGQRLAQATGRRSVTGRVFAGAAKRFTRGRTSSVFRVLSLAPRLFRPFIAFNARMMPFGTLDRQDIERVILRTAWRTGSEYEWRQHCAVGLDVGLTADEIRAIAGDKPGLALPAHSRVLLRAVDDLLDRHAIGDAVWDELRGILTDGQIVELCLLTGNYAMLAGALNSYATPIERPLRPS